MWLLALLLSIRYYFTSSWDYTSKSIFVQEFENETNVFLSHFPPFPPWGRFSRFDPSLTLSFLPRYISTHSLSFSLYFFTSFHHFVSLSPSISLNIYILCQFLSPCLFISLYHSAQWLCQPPNIPKYIDTQTHTLTFLLYFFTTFHHTVKNHKGCSEIGWT